MCNEITVLLLETKYASNIFAFKHSDLADRVIDEYVLNNWDKHYPDVLIPEDINDAVEYFFLMSMTDSYTIDFPKIFDSFEQFQEEDLL